MPDNPLEVLREMAKQSKGRVSSISLYDANVCTWTHPADRSWEYIIVSGEPFSKQLRYAYRGHRIRIFASNYFLEAAVAGSFAIDPLSINRKNANDPLLKAAYILTMNDGRYSCFTKSGMLSSSHKNFFVRVEFIALMRELNLQSQESVHFAQDNVSVYLYKPPLFRVSTAIERLIDLAQSVGGDLDLDPSVLPVQFHPLIPLIKKWAIADDADREDFLETLSRSDLQSFASEVEPYLSSIDCYLDSFRSQPPPEEAVALGRLAECAVEARQHLKADRCKK